MDSPIEIQIEDHKFSLFISNARILEKIKNLAEDINYKLQGQEVDILIIMDGAELFSQAILPCFRFSYRVHKLRIKTYNGMHSGNAASNSIDDSLLEILRGKSILILEDIIESGFTLGIVLHRVKQWGVKDIHLATLLLKPTQLKYPVQPDFIGFDIGPEFVVGFGMDYHEQGRELKDIYRCIH